MLKICLVFWESEPQYAYKWYAGKKNMYSVTGQEWGFFKIVPMKMGELEK